MERLPSWSRRLRTQGFTLMELMISLALLGTVMVIVTMSLDTSMRFNDRFSRQTDINNRANDVLNKLAMQLRLAAGASLELPGAYPVGFQAKDSAKSTNVKAFYFAVSTGLGGAPTWAEQYEPFKRMIIYDYSVTPGRLLLQTRDALGNPANLEPLSEEVAENGFSLTRVGNTLQMSLTLRSQTRVQEEIIYTALAQTLFLRSTLNESSGSSSVTYVDNPEDADGNIAGATTSAPSVMFGNLVTELSSQQQLSMFFTAPIGKKIDPNTIVVTLGDSDNTVSAQVNESSTVTVGTATVTRVTYPPPAQWPSRNGTYSVTLTGNIPGTVTVTASAANAQGDKVEESKRYSKTNPN
jgi:prepilin-type N-terminal cleavage/methylation domain-containing protein